MKYLAIIITTLFALTAAASAETDPKKVAAILEGAKVCNATADPVACMTGFMAALGVEPAEEKAEEVIVESSDTAEVVVETKVESSNTVEVVVESKAEPSDKALCSKATNVASGLKTWKTERYHLYFVTEAKRRGLDCGVGTDSSSVDLVRLSIESLKAAFNSRTRAVRKSIQSKLSELDYYKDNIDGKWGKNTQKALLNYATAKGMDTKDADNLFSIILKTQTSSTSIVSILPKCVGVQEIIPKVKTLTYAKKWSDCYGSVDLGDGNEIISEWKDGLPHGLGTSMNSEGGSFTGTFKDGSYSKGKFIWPDGTSYDGEWKNTEKHGQGTLIENGNKYVGEFKNDKLQGQGIFTLASGGKYSGEFTDNNMTGLGVFTFPNGDQLVGQFRKGEPYDTTLIVKKETKEEKCESLGFTKKTEPFGNCILKLTELEILQTNKSVDTNTLNQNYSDIQKRESSAKKLQGLSQMLQGISDGLYGTSNSIQQQPTCFKKSEYTSGFNKICNYTCGVSGYSMTISKSQFCPFTTRR